MTPSQDPPVRVPLTARLDADLHGALTEAADADDRSTNALLNDAVRGWLERRQYDTARLDSPDAPPIVELVPLTEPGAFRPLVDGFPVPHLRAYRADPPPGWTGNSTDALGWHTLTLDGRFSTKAMSWGELWPMVWFMANAMAVAAGYSSHGPNATRLNPHGPNEEATDFRAWADNGWQVEDRMGRHGKGYELTLSFNWPHLDDGDLRCYKVRDEVAGFLSDLGARAVATRLIALGPMQAEPALTQVDADANRC